MLNLAPKQTNKKVKYRDDYLYKRKWWFWMPNLAPKKHKKIERWLFV